jgi:hypothetical protein
VSDALNRLTTEDDTHPGPQDRFRLVSAVQAKRDVDGSEPVWDLFTDPARLTAQMMTEIEGRVRNVVTASM